MVSLASIERGSAIGTSPAALLGPLAALVWAPAGGSPIWPALARCRAASSLAVGLFPFPRAHGVAAAG